MRSLSPQAYRLAGFANGAEANCTSGLCCRENAYNEYSPQTPLLPAPRLGYFLWYVHHCVLYSLSCISELCSDSPYSLITAVLEAIPPLTGTQATGFNFSLYTGDLLAHDPTNQLSRRVDQDLQYLALLLNLSKGLC